jgi:octopine/nopaline transport system permease protein
MMLPALLGFGSDGWAMALLHGCLLTLAIAAASMAIGTVWGGLLAWARARGPKPLAWLVAIYGVILRGVPELLVILLLYFSAPALIAALCAGVGLPDPGSPPPFLTGSLAVGLVSAAYQAEVFRGGLLAIAPGQWEAAQAAGLGPWPGFRRILLPQILRNILPAMGNVWQFNLKDSALISVTGLAELMRTSLVAAGSTREPLLFFGAAILLYLVLTSLSGLVFSGLERRSNPWSRR